MVCYKPVFLTFVMILSGAVNGQHLTHFTVGVEALEYYPQYSYDSKQGYRGAYKAILDLFAEQNGYTFTYKAFPIPDLYSEFIKETVDFKYPDNASWNSQNKSHIKIHYSDQVLQFTDGVMVLKKHYGEGIEHLKVLGIPKGFTPSGYKKLINKNKISLAEGDALKDVLGQLLIGHTDGAYVNKSVANYQLMYKFKMADRAVFDDTLPFTQDSYRLSSIKYPKVIQEFNDFLEKNRQKIRHIKSEYGVL